MQDGWRDNKLKAKRVRQAIAGVLGDDPGKIDRTLALAKSQNDY